MLSSPLDEVRQIGEWVLKVGKAEAPTLIKYAGCNAYLMKTIEKMSLQAEKVSPVHGSDFTLVDYDADGEEKSWLPSYSAFHRKLPMKPVNLTSSNWMMRGGRP